MSERIPIIKCDTHGAQPQTYVCAHIIEAVKNGEANGFWWSRSEDGVWDAICDSCNSLGQAAFDALGADNIKTICLGCFEDAAALNDVDIAD